MFCWWFNGNTACKFVMQVFSLSCLREWSLLVENRKWAGDTDRHRETLTGIGRHWQAWGDTDRHRETLTGIARHWQASRDTDRHRSFQGDCLSPLLLPDVLGGGVKLSSLKSNQSGHVYSTLATPFSPTELGFKGDPSSEAPQTLSMGMEWKIHSFLSAYSFVRWKVTLESR